MVSDATVLKSVAIGALASIVVAEGVVTGQFEPTITTGAVGGITALAGYAAGVETQKAKTK